MGTQETERFIQTVNSVSGIDRGKGKISDTDSMPEEEQKQKSEPDDLETRKLREEYIRLIITLASDGIKKLLTKEDTLCGKQNEVKRMNFPKKKRRS